MKKLVGLEGGTNDTWFKILDVKKASINIYPSIKDGKVMLNVVMDDVVMDAEFFKNKKKVNIPGHYAIVAGNAVCAAEGILDALEGVTLEKRYDVNFTPKYRAIAVNPNGVEIWEIADYEAELKKVCANA